MQHERAGFSLTGYPALIDGGDSVAIQVFASTAEQQAAMWAGTRRLLRLTVPAPTKQVVDGLDIHQKLLLNASPHRGAKDLLDDCANCAVDVLMRAASDHGGSVANLAWTETEFAALAQQVRAGIGDVLSRVVHAVMEVLSAATELSSELAMHLEQRSPGADLAGTVNDVRAQRDRLYYRGFVTDTGLARLPDVARYLRAARHRLGKAGENPHRDHQVTAQLHELEAEYADARNATAPEALPQLDEVRWMLQELRVSYFAQTLGTKYSVSENVCYAPSTPRRRFKSSLRRCSSTRCNHSLNSCCCYEMADVTGIACHDAIPRLGDQD